MFLTAAHEFLVRSRFYHAINFDKMHKIQIGPARMKYYRKVFRYTLLRICGLNFLMDSMTRQMVGSPLRVRSLF